MPPAPLPPLDALFARLVDGDRTASAPLFEQLWPVVLRFCGRLVRPTDAEDAAQQTLEKVYARLNDLDLSRPALGWVLAIATWECRTVRRRTQRRKEVGVEQSPAAVSEDAEALLMDGGLSGSLDAALAELPELDRETLLLTLKDEAPVGVHPTTFRKRRERAVMRLRTVWRALYGA